MLKLLPDVKSLEKILMLGKSEGKRRRGRQRMRWSDNITNSMGMNLRKLQKTVEDTGAWHPTVHGVAKSQTRLSGWSTITYSVYRDCFFCCCLVNQLCLTLCDPVDYSPPGSSIHRDSPGKNTGVGCHAFLQGQSGKQLWGPMRDESSWVRPSFSFLLFIPGCGWSNEMGLGVS